MNAAIYRFDVVHNTEVTFVRAGRCRVKCGITGVTRTVDCATQTVDVAKLPRAVDVTVKGVLPAPVVFGTEHVVAGE